MHKPIKFIYAALIITLIGGVVAFGVMKHQKKNDFDQNTAQFESVYKKVSKEDADTTTEKSQSILEMSSDLIGTWQNYGDPKNTIVYFADRSYQDIYDGEIISGGTWSMIESLKGTEFSDLNEEDSIYLKEVNNSPNYIGEGHNFYYYISFEQNLEDGKMYLYRHYYGGAGNGDSSYIKVR